MILPRSAIVVDLAAERQRRRVAREAYAETILWRPDGTWSVVRDELSRAARSAWRGLRSHTRRTSGNVRGSLASPDRAPPPTEA